MFYVMLVLPKLPSPSFLVFGPLSLVFGKWLSVPSSVIDVKLLVAAHGVVKCGLHFVPLVRAFASSACVVFAVG